MKITLGQPEAGGPNRPTLVSGPLNRLLRAALRLNVVWLALRAYRDPRAALNAMLKLKAMDRSLRGNLANNKWLRTRGRFFWNVNGPGWPSRAFNRFILSELDRIRPLRTPSSQLQAMIFSITSRCPLHCAHCYEWDNLAAQEHLTRAQLLEILATFQARGVANIQLSGGEPLSRFDDLLALVRAARPGTDLWILTSGFGLTPERARALRQAGLTGAAISLDHWDPDTHNRFRGHADAWRWVWEAVRNAQRANLTIALSLCATREFVSEENLWKYLRLASDNGVGLIRLLEPRSVGHFGGQDIELGEEQLRVLSDFCSRVNGDPACGKLPVIDYMGDYQRRTGCFGGDRFLYVDSRGDIHSCPFCQRGVGNFFRDPLEATLSLLKQNGCLKFAAAPTGYADGD